MSEHDETRRKTAWPSIATLLNALLSVTFLVLAAYIAWASSLVAGQDALQLRLLAALMAAYAVWRWFRRSISGREQ